jgi:hypothetical protein
MSHAGQDAKITSVRSAALLNKDAASGIADSSAVDMIGYDRVAFDISIGTTVDGAVFNAWVIESAESNLGNSTNITGAAISEVSAGANMNATTRTIDVYRPALRYVGVRFETVTQNITTLSAVARQYRGTGTMPVTVTTDHEYVAVRAN